MSRVTSRRLLLAKIESVYGTDPTPTASANAVYMGNQQISPHKATLVKRNVTRPYLGNFQSAVAQIFQDISFEVEIAGSGTAGTAPAYGPLMRACGMSETINATPVTGTAVAGATATITLAAGASSVDNAYKGMVINLTGGTGSGGTATILSYVGSTKVATLQANWTTPPDNTSTYSIPAQVVYQPVSNSYESATIYANNDGVQFKLTGSRGTVNLGFSLNGIPVYKFTMTGIYNGPTDVALPTPVFVNQAVPLAVNKDNTTGISVLGYAASVSDFSLDVANTVLYQSYPGGAEQIIITDRQSAGSITMEGVLGAAKDWWAATRAATTGLMTLLHGTTAGNKVQISGPLVQLMNPVDGNKSGIITLQGSLGWSPINGNDEFSISLL